MVRIATIVGSLSRHSINRQLADALAARLRTEADVDVVDISIANLPLYCRDLETQFPAEATRLKEEVRAVDGIAFLTPEYNRTFSAALKNALEWGSRPWGDNAFAGRAVAVLGTSPGVLGAAIAQHQLRPVLSSLGMPVMSTPELYWRYADNQFDGEVVTDADARERLDRFAQAFLTHVRRHAV
ncbi:MAG: NAD(P)H-dependent oxidoreductase [Bowdeniella nasicola]|nr:NAD(P)H-dependent oxidoreductase [Bowdeniella nasicola]